MEGEVAGVVDEHFCDDGETAGVSSLKKGDGSVGANLEIGGFDEGSECFFCFRNGAEGGDGKEIGLVGERDDGWDVRSIAEMKESDGCGKSDCVGGGVCEFFKTRDRVAVFQSSNCKGSCFEFCDVSVSESFTKHGEEVISAETGYVEDRFNACLRIWIFDKAAQGVGCVGGAKKGKKRGEVRFKGGGKAVHESFDLSHCVRMLALGHVEGGFHPDGQVV